MLKEVGGNVFLALLITNKPTATMDALHITFVKSLIVHLLREGTYTLSKGIRQVSFVKLKGGWRNALLAILITNNATWGDEFCIILV